MEETIYRSLLNLYDTNARNFEDKYINDSFYIIQNKSFDEFTSNDRPSCIFGEIYAQGGFGKVYLIDVKGIKFIVKVQNNKDRMNKEVRNLYYLSRSLIEKGKYVSIPALQFIGKCRDNKGRFFIVEEFIEGTSAGTETTIPTFLNICRTLWENLLNLYDAGLSYHGDLHLNNVLVDSKYADIIDLGLSRVRITEPTGHPTTYSNILGDLVCYVTSYLKKKFNMGLRSCVIAYLIINGYNYENIKSIDGLNNDEVGFHLDDKYSIIYQNIHLFNISILLKPIYSYAKLISNIVRFDSNTYIKSLFVADMSIINILNSMLKFVDSRLSRILLTDKKKRTYRDPNGGGLALILRTSGYQTKDINTNEEESLLLDSLSEDLTKYYNNVSINNQLLQV